MWIQIITDTGVLKHILAPSEPISYSENIYIGEIPLEYREQIKRVDLMSFRACIKGGGKKGQLVNTHLHSHCQ